MALNANSYGSVAGVEALVRHIAGAGGFTIATKPTLAEVESFIDQRSAILNAWLGVAGYTIPASNAQAQLILAHYAQMGAACDVELTQRSAGYSDNDQNRRENKFCAEFMRAQKLIGEGNLPGAPSAPGGPLAGLSVGGVTRGGIRLQPLFRRTSFGNDPAKESPLVDEPDYTEDGGYEMG
jgi:hypothetical protein